MGICWQICDLDSFPSSVQGTLQKVMLLRSPFKREAAPRSAVGWQPLAASPRQLSMSRHSGGSRARLIWISAPDCSVGMASSPLQMHCSLRLFLAHLPSFPLSYSQMSDLHGSLKALPADSCSFPFLSFSGNNTTKSLLTPSQHLLLGGPDITNTRTQLSSDLNAFCLHLSCLA